MTHSAKTKGRKVDALLRLTCTTSLHEEAVCISRSRWPEEIKNEERLSREFLFRLWQVSSTAV